MNYYTQRTQYHLTDYQQSVARKRHQSVKMIPAIGKYICNLQNMIGQGMSSQVFKGINSHEKQQVSIKIILKEAMKDKKIDQLFRNEVKLLKMLNNQHILKLIDVQQNQKHFWIITEYCQHGDLQKILRKNKKFSEEKALEYFTHIIHGYKQIFKSQIIHRDLKLANILITSGNQAKIADFGFAIFKNDLKSPNLNAGSPLYMPPQALQKGQFSFKSDIFGLGIILYEMLHGKTPWPAKTQKQLIYKMKTNSYIIDEKLSDQSKYLIKNCLNINIQKRMQAQHLFTYIQQNLTKKNRNDQNSRDIKSNLINNIKNIELNKQNDQKTKQKNIDYFRKKLSLVDYTQKTHQNNNQQKNIFNNKQQLPLKDIQNTLQNIQNNYNKRFSYLNNFNKQNKYNLRSYKPGYKQQKSIISIKKQNKQPQKQDLSIKIKLQDLINSIKKNIKNQILSYLPNHIIIKMAYILDIYKHLLNQSQFNFQQVQSLVTTPSQLLQDAIIRQLKEYCNSLIHFSKIVNSFFKRIIRLIAHYTKQSKAQLLMISQILSFYVHMKDLQIQDQTYWKRKDYTYEKIQNKDKLRQLVCRYLI